jgi:hypothetical protein
MPSNSLLTVVPIIVKSRNLTDSKEPTGLGSIKGTLTQITPHDRAVGGGTVQGAAGGERNSTILQGKSSCETKRLFPFIKFPA